MKKSVCVFVALFSIMCAKAQVFELEKVANPSPEKDVSIKKMTSDERSSTFLIWIRSEVKAHKHLEHSEMVFVLDGKGEMRLGSKLIKVKKGDMIYIPKGEVHAVKVISKRPLKVVSVQAPEFMGKDRVFVD